MYKILFVVLISLFLIGCNGCDLGGQNNPINVKLTWDANVEPDMDHYRVYWYQTDDTTGFQGVPDMQYIENIPHPINVSSDFTLTLDYVIAGVIAVDTDNLQSTMAFTPRFYRYSEFAAPSVPQNLRIIP